MQLKETANTPGVCLSVTASSSVHIVNGKKGFVKEDGHLQSSAFLLNKNKNKPKAAMKQDKDAEQNKIPVNFKYAALVTA